MIIDENLYNYIMIIIHLFGNENNIIAWKIIVIVIQYVWLYLTPIAMLNYYFLRTI